MTSTAEKDPPKEDELVTSREPSKRVAVEGSASDVDFSTISTTEPSPQNHGTALPDGSVISAITDHASLGGTMNPASSTATGPAVSSMSDTAVPEQVILDSESPNVLHQNGTVATEVSSMHNSDRRTHSELSEQQLALKTDSQSMQSSLAIPDASPNMEDETNPEPHLASGDSLVAITPPTQQKQQQVSVMMDHESDDTLDDYIRSPEVQNAIVERSPGGRYVRFMEKLGSGASKDVYRAYDTQEGIEVAWNVVTLSGVPKTERNRIVNEVRLLERLHHANIISFHGSWVNRERQEVIFVTEILSSGTLKSFITKVQVIRWKIAKRWAMQILKGLEYLHSQDPPVIHRDLKCENIFINGTSGDLRIGDLGLSTVHRIGRKLSVLGTPEFMAPDMYDERPYDEKVDIYAFGMCMLEIFTKEIPYSECNNPAQIYKKVSAGDPPEILSRLQSRHAREFVEFCMGFKDENGFYVRPSASELLKHPFLMKRPNDDDEVVVERPLRERTIVETAESSNGSSTQRRRQHESATVSVSSSSKPQHAQHHHSQSSSSVPEPVASAPSSRQQEPTTYDEADGNDHFDEMPESETNMKKVKVLMGRDQVLNEEDEDDHPPDTSGVLHEQNDPATSLYNASHESAVAPPQTPEVAQGQSDDGQMQTAVSARYNLEVVSSPPPQGSDDGQMQTAAVSAQYNLEVVSSPPPQGQESLADGGRTPSDNNQRHYLVAAAVIEHEGPDVRPYADDILKLVVTLPVEGQTQNVQFEFHLVEDDAVQVAKEMVQELDIPQEAVLEISETISGLACSARMKQDKYTARMIMQGQERADSEHVGASSTTALPDPTSDAKSGTNSMSSSAPVAVDTMAPTGPSSMESSYGASEAAPSNLLDQDVAPAAGAQQTSQPDLPGHAHVTTDSQTVPHPQTMPGQQIVRTSGNGMQAGSSSTQGIVKPAHQLAETSQRQLASVQQAHSTFQVVSDAQAQVQSVSDTTGQPQTTPQQQHTTPNHQGIPLQATVANVPGGPAPAQQALPGSLEHQPQAVSGITTDLGSAPKTSSVPGPMLQEAGRMASKTTSATTPVEAQLAPNTPVPVAPALPPRPTSGDLAAGGHGDMVSVSADTNGMPPRFRREMYNIADETNDEVREKLRKLEEDYQKNLKIAKKVFDSRMENLERSQTEKEALHQKTLEKHEKERVAFEKRRALEEEQQLRRIELLQKEWDKKREMLAQEMNAEMDAEEQAMSESMAGTASVVSTLAGTTTIPDQLEPPIAPPAGTAVAPAAPAQRTVSTASPTSSALPPPLPEPQQQPP